MNTFFYFLTKQATLMRRSTVVCLLLQLVFPAFFFRFRKRGQNGADYVLSSYTPVVAQVSMNAIDTCGRTFTLYLEFSS